MKHGANKPMWTKFIATEFYFESNKCHNLYVVTNVQVKKYLPKATGGGFLIFEWTLHINKNQKTPILTLK
jgi:hypothetical protein